MSMPIRGPLDGSEHQFRGPLDGSEHQYGEGPEELARRRMARPVRGATRFIPDFDKIAPVISFDEFESVFDWRQGQHMSMIGPTDSGKTTLALHLLNQMHYVVALATKPRDATLDALQKRGYRRMEEWKNFDPELFPKRLLWPRADRLYSAKNQRAVFQQALAHIYPQGGWCVFFDELWYLCNQLRLRAEIETLLTQARSNKISLVVGTQRPAAVPLLIYDQAQHLFFWNDNDEANLKRLSGISWANSAVIKQLVATLRKHEVLYISTRSNPTTMYRFIAPPPEQLNLAEAG